MMFAGKTILLLFVFILEYISQLSPEHSFWPTVFSASFQCLQVSVRATYVYQHKRHAPVFTPNTQNAPRELRVWR